MGELAASIRTFREIKNYEISRIDNAQDSTDPLVRVQWRVKILRPIPDEWAYLVGDIVNNMRSALDHALAEIARSRLGLSDKDVQKRRLQFPINSDPVGFAKSAKDLKKIFPQEVVDLLEALQPYHDPEDSSRHNLAMLRDVSNLDKHRQLSIVEQGVFRSTVILDPPLEIVELREGRGPLADRAVVATVKFRRRAGVPEVILRPEVRHVESLVVPWSTEMHPLAVVLELMFDDAFNAVESLTRELTGPLDVAYIMAYGQQEEERNRDIMATVATAEEIEALEALEAAADPIVGE